MVHSLHPEAMSTDAIPLIFGLVVAAMVYATGHISGAHLNPAVTLAFASTKRFPWKEVPAYLGAQTAGALLAMGVLIILLPATPALGETLPSIDAGKALLWETILTYFLMFVIMSVATDSRAVGMMAGIAIGATVAFDAFIGGAITGASMNPARSLAPAVFSGNMAQLWIYFLGPVTGAVLGALSYEFVRCSTDDNKSNAKGCC